MVSIESNTAALSSGVLNDVGENAISNEPSELLKKLINIPEGEEWRFTPRELYRRYGARPAPKRLQHVIEKPNDSGTKRRDGREPAATSSRSFTRCTSSCETGPTSTR